MKNCRMYIMSYFYPMWFLNLAHNMQIMIEGHFWRHAKQLKILGKNGDSMETKLYSSISGGWRLFQPFIKSQS